MKHIAFNLDNGYARHVATVMVSVMENNTSGPVTFHCVCMNVEPDQKALLTATAERYGTRVEYYDADLRSLPEFPKLKEHDYVSLATYLRLFMAELLPPDIDRVLYLDGDTMVRHDLDELWDTDIEGHALAAVGDAWVISDHGSQRLGFEKRYGYFNAGVLLANLRRWRETQASGRFREIIAEYGERLFLHDQDVLNIAFHDSRVPLDHKWNMFAFARYKYPDQSVWRDDPAIVHYVNSGKPWLYHPDRIFIGQWRRYAKKTPWGLPPRTSYKRVKYLFGKTVATGYVLGLGHHFDRYRYERRQKRSKKNKSLL